jgi:hypothetical protein
MGGRQTYRKVGESHARAGNHSPGLKPRTVTEIHCPCPAGDRWQLADGLRLGRPEGVVLVRLPLQVPELPRLGRRIG